MSTTGSPVYMWSGVWYQTTRSRYWHDVACDRDQSPVHFHTSTPWPRSFFKWNEAVILRPGIQVWDVPGILEADLDWPLSASNIVLWYCDHTNSYHSYDVIILHDVLVKIFMIRTLIIFPVQRNLVVTAPFVIYGGSRYYIYTTIWLGVKSCYNVWLQLFTSNTGINIRYCCTGASLAVRGTYGSHVSCADYIRSADKKELILFYTW